MPHTHKSNPRMRTQYDRNLILQKERLAMDQQLEQERLAMDQRLEQERLAMDK